MKTLKISDETHWLLSQIKAEAKYKSFDDLLMSELCFSQLMKGAIKEKNDKSKK